MRYLFLSLVLLAKISIAQQITWSAPIDVSSSSNGNLHPRIETDALGDPVIIWGKSSSSQCMFSKWIGSGFSSPTPLNNLSLPVFTASWAGPDIAAKGDTIYVVIKGTPEDVNPVYIISSFDGGQSFSSPIQVDFISPNLSRFPTIAIDESGNPLVGFMKFDPGFSNARWVVSRSSDFGFSFSTDILASGWSGGTVCDCCPGSLISYNNSALMIYRDNLNNVRDMWTALSNDNGSTFSSGWNIDLHNWMLMACPSTGADAVVIGDSLYSVFMNGATGTSKVYLSRASISGMSTSSVSDLSGNNSQNYPRISEDESALGTVWRERVGQIEKGLIRFTSDIFNNESYVDTVAFSGVVNLDIAVSRGKVYVVWQDDVSGTVKFREGNYTPSTYLTEQRNNNARISVYPNPVYSNEINFDGDIDPGNFSFCIKNLQNQIVLNDKIRINNGQGRINIDLRSGFYIFELDLDGQTSAFKIVVQ